MPAKKKTSPVTPEEAIVPPAPVEPIVPVAPPQPVGPAVPAAPAAGSAKPGLVTAISIMTLINGIINILYGLSITAGVVLGTFFFGIICAPVTILPVILGIFEVVYAAKLLANPPQAVQPSQTIAILEIVAVVSGNVISLVVGILALVFYADQDVKAYFARINSQA